MDIVFQEVTHEHVHTKVTSMLDIERECFLDVESTSKFYGDHKTRCLLRIDSNGGKLFNTTLCFNNQIP